MLRHCIEVLVLLFFLAGNWNLRGFIHEGIGIRKGAFDRENTSVAVFEIARWTEARDWQKQRRYGKATVYAGPKVCQSNLVFGNSHFSFKVPNCLIIWIFIVPMCGIFSRTGFLLHFMQHYLVKSWFRDNFLDIAYFFGPPKVNVGPPKVSSLMDRLSINSHSTISKTAVAALILMKCFKNFWAQWRGTQAMLRCEKNYGSML